MKKAVKKAVKKGAKVKKAVKKVAGKVKKAVKKAAKKTAKKVEKVMHEFKEGKLRSGTGGKGGKVKSRKQAIAIGLNEAREAGEKVPKPKNPAGGSRKKTTKRSNYRIDEHPIMIMPESE